MKKKNLRGRRPSSPGTVRILKGGNARLSPDLVIGDFYEVTLGKKKTVTLKALEAPSISSLKVWKSNPHARSAMLSFAGILKALAMTPSESVGEFKASVSDGCIEVKLDKRIGV